MGKVLGIFPSKWALPLGIVFLLALGFGTGWGSHGFSVSSVQTNVGNVGGGGVSPTPTLACITTGTDAATSVTTKALLNFNDNNLAPDQSVSGFLYGTWGSTSAAGAASGTGVTQKVGTSGNKDIVGRASAANYWDAVYNLQGFCVVNSDSFKIPMHSSSGATIALENDNATNTVSTTNVVGLENGIARKVNVKVSANTTHAYITNPQSNANAGKSYFSILSNQSKVIGSSSTIAAALGYTSCSQVIPTGDDAGYGHWNQDGFASDLTYVCSGLVYQSVNVNGAATSQDGRVQTTIYPGDADGKNSPYGCNTTMYVGTYPANAYDVGTAGSSDYHVQYSAWYLNGTLVSPGLRTLTQINLGALGTSC